MLGRVWFGLALIKFDVVWFGGVFGYMGLILVALDYIKYYLFRLLKHVQLRLCKCV